MILNQLTLTNFCVYRGEQSIDLRPVLRNGKARSIVLFGGINGGGKTTLLDAIQLVLYGNRASCSKKNEKSYEQFLSESVHRSVPLSHGAAISLTFDYSSEGQKNTFEVHRRWATKGSKVKETVVVKKDGKVDRWLSENWSQQVEDLLPQSISQLCFFDAEKIRFLAEDETSNATLGNAIKALLGLDLAERLIVDASVLEGKIAKRARPSDEKTELDAIEQELDIKSQLISTLIQEAASHENLRLVAQRNLIDAERNFEAVGGRHWDNRQVHQQELSGAEGQLQSLNAQLCELASSELPILMLSKFLRSLSDRIESSKAIREAEVISGLLSTRDQRLIADLADRGIDPDAIAVTAELLERDRQSRAVESGELTAMELSTNALTQLGSLSSGFAETKRDSARIAVELSRKLTHEIEDLQRILSATPKESGVKEASEALKLAYQEVARFEDLSKRANATLQVERQARSSLEEQVKRLRKKIADFEIANEEDARFIRLLSRTQETMQVFLQRATESKIGKLSEYISESFGFLLRKKALVERVVIDPVTFSIELEDQVGNRISKQQLSEGEKQIFAISVLWGLSRAAARPLPAIIDTPMGRLDSEHRNALLERYFPNASHQVVILSTDTEIEEEAFEKIQSAIARAYHLNYDDEEKATTVTEGYFWQPSA
jgi:DNA sulfur modification protein DndD